jgi:diguanylate cyclase (GGDEF)-like protein/PAS domain S-box-containing protein
LTSRQHIGATGTPAPDRFIAGQLLDALTEAVVAVDPEGRVQHWNDAAERLFGWTREQACGRTVHELFVPEESVDAVRTWVRDVIEAGSALRDWSVVDRSGSRSTVAVAGSRLTGPDGEVIGMVGVARDVGERNRARSRFDARFWRSGMPQILVGVDGRVDEINDACSALLGLDRHELVGRSVAHVSADAEGDDQVQALLASARTGGATSRQYRRVLRRGDGSRLPVLVTASVVLGDDGAPSGIAAYLTDLTSLEQAERDLQQQEALFRALVQRASDVAVVNGPDGSVLYCSPASEQIFGFPAAQVLGGNGYDYVHPEDEAEVRRTFDRVAARPEDTATMRYRHRHAQDGWRWVEVTVSNRLRDPEIGGIVANLRDVTARVEAECALRLSEERYRAIADTAQEGIWVADATGRTLYLNAKMTELLGRPAEQVYGRHVLEVLGAGQSALMALRLRDREQRGSEEYDLEYAHPDGERRWFRVASSPLHDGASGYVGSLAMVCDVTEVRRGEAALRRLALHDSVTELPNRTLLADRLAQATERCARSRTPLSVLFVDIDQFKVVNDALGHAAGDELLRAVAARLAAAARPGDTVGRFGGDEFVVVAEGADADAGERIAADLQASLQEPFDLAGRSIFVSVSIGVSTSPTSAPDELLRHADAAMYVAKSRGRRRSERFDADTADALRDRLDLAADLRSALDTGGLELHYQPVVGLTDGRLLGLEALARWNHPDRGPVPRPLFVAVAQETGLAADFDRWVLQRACADVARLRRAGVVPDSAHLAVNVSAGHVSDGDLVHDVLTAARTAGLPPTALMIEVTESDAVQDVDAARSTLQRLRDAGVLVAIDDFGTGYSSLAYLKRLPVDRIKIDRLFVESIASSADDLAIVASVVELSRAIGASVIAEGIETREQLGLLKRLGCQAGQGWLWSPAVPPAELPALLAAQPGRGFDVEHQITQAPRRRADDRPVGAEHGLRRLLQLQAEGASLRTIAAALNAEGYRTPPGTRWHPRSVANVIADRAYPTLWPSGTAEEPDPPTSRA